MAITTQPLNDCTRTRSWVFWLPVRVPYRRATRERSQGDREGELEERQETHVHTSYGGESDRQTDTDTVKQGGRDKDRQWGKRQKGRERFEDRE